MLRAKGGFFMKEYNLKQRTAEALVTENTDEPEKTLENDVMLEVDIIRFAVEAANENLPIEQVREAYEKLKEFMPKILSDYCYWKNGLHCLDNEMDFIKSNIQDAESVFYSHDNKIKQIETQIDLCGVFHPFRKAELKEQLKTLREEKPELPKELYANLAMKKQEYEKTKDFFTQLDKDFDKLQQILEKLAEKLNPVKNLAKTVTHSKGR